MYENYRRYANNYQSWVSKHESFLLYLVNESTQTKLQENVDITLGDRIIEDEGTDLAEQLEPTRSADPENIPEDESETNTLGEIDDKESDEENATFLPY